MHNEYMKEEQMIEKSEREKEVELILSIIRTREELKNANRNFEYAGGDLIDYYTYQIKANQSKLDYLIKMAKSRGITVDMINDIKFRLLDREEDVG